MNPSAVLLAARHASQTAMEAAAAMALVDARCIPSSVLSAVKKPKYPLNPVAIDRSTAAIAIASIE